MPEKEIAGIPPEKTDADMRQRNFTEEEYTKIISRHIAKGGVEGHARKPQYGASALRRGRLDEANKLEPVSSPAPSLNPYAPYRSKLELQFSKELDLWCKATVAASWRYEDITFHLPGSRNRYTPDFHRIVMGENGAVEHVFFEVKGWSRSYDRSLVKLKTAAGLNSWARFILVTYKDRQWQERIIA